jgi:poly(3-hydroxybutyrate) depolymerase
MLSSFSYQMYEMTFAALAPARALSDASRLLFGNPLNPISQTPLAKNISAGAEMFERVTRRYGKPNFGHHRTSISGREFVVEEEIVWEKPFCSLVHFARPEFKPSIKQPKLLIVAPMSGHYATLLRGTVEAFLPTHDVYITDWKDARMVGLSAGVFDLDDYIDYLREIFARLGPGVHSLGVCQPAVPLIAAIALMEAADDPAVPASMTLMGGPIDTRCNPTAVNLLAEERGVDWFRRNCLHVVPLPYPGFGRAVYPGFLQLSGFMAMNIDRHVHAHVEMFSNLVAGDGDSAEKHREFYDEYMSVADLTADYYMQTVETVFVKHSLPKGEMRHRDNLIDLSSIHRCALLTVEGENDDISGVGQTFAAHALCSGLCDEYKRHYLQQSVGHYGVFNGSRFRTEIAPRIVEFHGFVDARALKSKLSLVRT